MPWNTASFSRSHALAQSPTLPAMWSAMLAEGETVANAFTGPLLEAQIEVPVECRDDAVTPDSAAVGAVSYATAISAGTAFTVEIGDNTYEVNIT